MKVNQLKAGAVLSYTAMGLGYLVSLVYTPLMLRLLGQSEYGLYNLVASIVAYLGILSFGFDSAYMRYYSQFKITKNKDELARLNGMFLIIFSVIGLVAVLAGMILLFNTEKIFGSELTSVELYRSKILMAIMVVNIAFTFPNMIFNSHITAHEQFIFQKLLLMIRTIMNPFIVLPVLLMGYKSVGMVVATTVLNIVVIIVNILFCIVKLKIKFSFKNFNVSLMREMTTFSSYVFIGMIVDQINWNIDKFILGRFYGTITVAVYGLASQLNMYYLTLSTAISNVFIPRVHKMVVTADNNKEITALFTRVGRIQFILLSLILTGLIFFGRAFINMWAGTNYDGSYLITLILIIPVTIPLAQNIGIEIQRAKNMHQFRSWIYLCIACANILLTIPLARSFQGVGAALGTAISLIIGNILIMNWYYQFKVGLDMKIFWKQILQFIPSLLGPVAFGIVVNHYFDLYTIKYFLLYGIAYVFIYSSSMWFIGMNQFEKDLIGKPVKKILKNLIPGIH